MDESLQEEAIFAGSLKAAAAATAGSSGGRQALSRNSDDSERQAKIERLRRQIASGEYQVNAAELSKRLIDDHLAT